MGFRLPSYGPDGPNHCEYSTRDEPCFGKTSFFFEDVCEETGNTYVTVACVGHQQMFYQKSYFAADDGAPVYEDEE